MTDQTNEGKQQSILNNKPVTIDPNVKLKEEVEQRFKSYGSFATFAIKI